MQLIFSAGQNAWPSNVDQMVINLSLVVINRYMFPSVTELAQQIGMVLEYFE